MAGDASVLKDEIEKIQDALGDGDDDDEYDSDESGNEQQLYIDLGLSSRGKSSAHHDASSLSEATTYGLSTITADEDSRSQVYSVTDSTAAESNTTDLPIDVETCLALNRAYQEILTEHLDQIKTVLNENREKQKLIESNLDEGTKDKVKDTSSKKVRAYHLPYFRNSNGLTPPANEDVKMKQFLQEKKQEADIKADWIPATQKQLITAVSKDALQKVLRPLMNRRENLQNKYRIATTDEERQELLDLINKVEEEIESRKKTREDILLKNVDHKTIDWMKIAKFDFNGKREWYDIQKIWEVVVNPEINKSEWTSKETKHLIQLVDKYKTGNWEIIVQELGTKRDPFQAMQYYQMNLNTAIQHKRWSPEDDEKLLEAYEQCKDVQTHRLKWKKVSELMIVRSADACRRRWGQVDPRISRERWLPEEDVRLMLAVKLIGDKEWLNAAKYVPNRTSAQCRERYTNYLNPSLQLGRPYSYEEDKQILKLVHEHGVGRWAKIASFMTGRTDNRIAVRYRKLAKWKKTDKWFQQQTEGVKRVLQGLPAVKTPDEQVKVNWKTYFKLYGLSSEHYEKRDRDLENNDEFAVIYPPLLEIAPTGRRLNTYAKYSEQSAVMRHIDKLLDGENLSEAERDCRKSEILRKLQKSNASGKQLSVKHLLNKARAVAEETKIIRNEKCQQRKKVIRNIYKVVKVPKKNKITAGRPRKYFHDQEYLSEKEKKQLSVSVLSLVTKAMEVNGKEMLTKYSQCQKTNPRSVSQQHDVNIFTEVVLQDGSYSEINKKPDTSASLSGGRSRSSRSSIAKTEQNEEVTLEDKLRNLDDAAASSSKNGPSEDLPFLPPNFANIKGIKTLLLARRDLIAKAGKCYTLLKQISTKRPTRSLLKAPKASKAPKAKKPVQKRKNSLVVDPKLATNSSTPKSKKDYENLSSVQVIHVYPKTTDIEIEIDNAEDVSTVVNSDDNIHVTTKSIFTKEVDWSGIAKGHNVMAAIHNIIDQEKDGDPSTNNEQNFQIGHSSEMTDTTQNNPNTQSPKSFEASKVKKTKKRPRSKSKSGNQTNNNETVEPPTRYYHDVNNIQEPIVEPEPIEEEPTEEEPIVEPSEEENILWKIKQSHDYKMLQARFQSLFVWPALMSSTYVNPDPDEVEDEETVLQKMKERHRNKVRRGYPCLKTPQFYKFAAKKRKEKEIITQRLLGVAPDIPVEGEHEEENLSSGKKRGRPRKHEIRSPNNSLNTSIDTSVDAVEGEPPNKKKAGRPKGSKRKIPVVVSRRSSSRFRQRKNYSDTVAEPSGYEGLGIKIDKSVAQSVHEAVMEIKNKNSASLQD